MKLELAHGKGQNMLVFLRQVTGNPVTLLFELDVGQELGIPGKLYACVPGNLGRDRQVPDVELGHPGAFS